MDHISVTVFDGMYLKGLGALPNTAKWLITYGTKLINIEIELIVSIMYYINKQQKERIIVKLF